MDKAYIFERKMVEIVVEMAKEQGKNFSQLARETWPTAGNPIGKWRAIRRFDKDKPANIKIADGFRLAQALGVDFPSLCFLVNERLKVDPVVHLDTR